MAVFVWWFIYLEYFYLSIDNVSETLGWPFNSLYWAPAAISGPLYPVSKKSSWGMTDVEDEISANMALLHPVIKIDVPFGSDCKTMVS